MKRFTVIVAILAVGLVAPTALGAAAKTYEGTVDSGGTIEFKVKKTNNAKKVKPTLFLNVPAECTSGVETVSGNIPIPGKVKGGEFEINAESSSFDAQVTVKGEINGSSAEGTIRVHGSQVLVDPPANGERSECDTGTVDWSAEKV